MANENGASITQEDPGSKNRRDSAKQILWVLVTAVGGLSLLLVGSIFFLKDLPGQLSGIVLTTLAGAISSLLSFIGLIVKGLIDNLTER